MNRESVESYLNSALTQVVPPSVDTDILNQLHANHVKSLDLLQGLGLDEKKITSDPTTTAAGKVPKYKAFSDQAVPRFAYLGRVIGDANGTIARLTRLMLDPLTARPTDMDQSEAYSRERDLRREIGREGANAEFLRAVEGNDLETIRALLTGPGKPWISQDVRLRGEEVFAERTQPEAYATRRSVEWFRDHATALAEMIRQWLTGLGADKELAAKTLLLK